VASLLAVALCTSCASAIYSSGRFKRDLNRGSERGDIRAALGEPVASGQDRNFGYWTFDDFVVRGPVYDRSRVGGAAMGAGMTFGLSEFISAPQALWWSITDRGCKRVRVFYSEDLHYKLHFVADMECKLPMEARPVAQSRPPKD
jgi:hypothetical protein